MDGNAEVNVVVEDNEVQGSGSGWENEVKEEDSWQTGPEASVADDVVDEPAGVVEESFVEPPEEAKIFVGNLPFDVDSENLAKIFDQAGVVEIAEVRKFLILGGKNFLCISFNICVACYNFLITRHCLLCGCR